MATGTFKDYKAVVTEKTVPDAIARTTVLRYAARAINADDHVVVSLADPASTPFGRITKDDADVYAAEIGDLCEILVNLTTGEKRLYVKEGLVGSECEGQP